MKELNISPNFTVEDIHKIREYNYEMTKDMSKEDRRAYYRAGAERMEKRIEEHRRSKELK
jgi:precorrin-2 methylase